MTHVKICGIKDRDVALACVDAGADAIGLNFHARSVRCVSTAVARDIVDAVGKRALTVGVFVDASYEEILAFKQEVGFVCAQLHGDESPELLERLQPHAYKALRVRGPDVLELARRYGGEHLMLDAYVRGKAGGTGASFDWEIARELAMERNVTLAGGLSPDNVAHAVARVAPFCVDVASGVESAPAVKDIAKVRRFIAEAKSAPAPSKATQ